MLDAESLTSQQVGPYKIGAQLGVGGMGAVYAAVHERLGRRVAIKVLHANHARDKEIVQRFFNEARAVNLIDHPGLIQIWDFDQLSSGAAYLVMELLSGEPLASHLARQSAGAPLSEVLRFGWQIADTLAAVHGQNIVHRDLKPSNIMIVSDPAVVGGKRTKLLDFGIAKLGSERLLPNQAQTTTKTVMGTLLYMSPEQCRSARLADGRSDVYSLGIMLYEMLTGRPPFLGESEVEVITMHLQEAPRPLAEVSPGTPPLLSRLVHRMLAKENEKRPTMRETANQLDALMRQLTDCDAPIETAAGSDSGLGFAPTLAGPPGSQRRSTGPARSWRSGFPMRVGSLALVGALSLLIGMQVGQRKPAARSSSQSTQPEQTLPPQTASPPLPPPTLPTAAPPAAPSAAPAQPAAVVSVAAAAQVAGASPGSAGIAAAAEDAAPPPAAKGSSRPGAPLQAGIVRAGTKPPKEKKPAHTDRLTAESPAEPSARPAKSTTDVKTTRHDTTRTVDD